MGSIAGIIKGPGTPRKVLPKGWVSLDRTPTHPPLRLAGWLSGTRQAVLGSDGVKAWESHFPSLSLSLLIIRRVPPWVGPLVVNV